MSLTSSNRPAVAASAVVHAPLARCFALSTRVELVQRTLRMTPVSGVTTGHVTAGSRVHWQGWKFGLPTSHHTLITSFAAPHPGKIGDGCTRFDLQPVAWFEDSQEKGRFQSFSHLHLFRETTEGTELEDRVFFTLPFGILGRVVARNIMGPYVHRLMEQRFHMIKELAETDGWKSIL